MTHTTMCAVVLDEPGPATKLHVRDAPVPEPRPGWVLIEVKAFGLNRSELFTRLGPAHPGRHLVRRHGRCPLGQAPGHDRAVHHPQPRQGRYARRSRRRPHPH
jgi:NADPH:quinone reductase-like Zn-dependent oxidoreductase